MSHMFFSVIYICFNKEKQSLIPTPQRHLYVFIYMLCSYAVCCIMLKGVETGYGLLGYSRCRFADVCYRAKQQKV